MTVYAVRDIARYQKGDEVQVFHAKDIDGETYFLVWSKNLKMWCYYRPENFAPYPFWMEDDDGKD